MRWDQYDPDAFIHCSLQIQIKFNIWLFEKIIPVQEHSLK